MSPLRSLLLALPLALGACAGDPSDPNDPNDPDPPDSGDASIIFDESLVRTYELTVDPSDWQWLNDNARLEEFVPTTLSFEGEVYDQVAIRYKGGFGTLYSCFDFGGNQTCDKLSIKLKFSEYDPDRKFFGLKRLNFHSMERDPSRMRDAISYKLFRDHGVYGPRTAFARVVVNGELLGLYVVVEQIDGRFARANFPDGGKGNVYKEIWPVHSDPQPYLDALKSNRNDSPSADKMVRFAQDLAAADDSTFEATLEKWTDVDHLMMYMAIARLVDHWDDIVGWYCAGGPCFNHNYYWYESTAEDRLWLVPWDTDLTFQEPSPIRAMYGMPDWDEIPESCAPIPIFFGITGLPPACDDFIRRMATVLWDRYADASRMVLDGDFQLPALEARIDELEALLADAVAEDPNGVSVAQWQQAVTGLRAAVAAKRAHIEAKLDAQ